MGIERFNRLNKLRTDAIETAKEVAQLFGENSSQVQSHREFINKLNIQLEDAKSELKQL